ncbi:MAG: T9SS type A sorting domain-containing protein [Bacteroidetes bacterium]|nr:T9SS type A sorting domain-containing protein [Bacteroidota bacterium]
MKHLLSIFILFAFSISSAQISLNQEDYFKFGNKYYRGYLNAGLDTIEMESTSGAAQMWDFSWLESDITDSLLVTKADVTPFFSEFPSAEFAISTQANNYFYEELNPDGVRILGRVVYDGVQDFNTIYQFNTVGNSFQFPMEYGTNYSFSYGYRVQYPAVFPGSDSIRNFNHSVFNIEVDAWGTLILPMGPFDVIRVKQTAYITDTTQIYDFPAGWFSPTVTLDTVETWLFYTEDIGYRLMSYSQRISGTNKGLNWIRDFVLGTDELKYNSTVQIFPQPADRYLNFSSPESGICKMIDIHGKLIQEINIQKGTNQIDISQFAPGIYLLGIQEKSGNYLRPAKFIISR